MLQLNTILQEEGRWQVVTDSQMATYYSPICLARALQPEDPQH